MNRIEVAIAQIAPVIGNRERNVAQHTQQMALAHQNGADLVIFPELSLTGYFVKDLVAELACKPSADDPYFGQLLAKTQELGIDAVIGFIEESERGVFYISAAYLSLGEVVHVHRKVHLPTYGMFQDSRFFGAGDKIRAFDTRFGRMGLLICEDYWHIALPYILWQDGADVLILINASPGRGLNEAPRAATSVWIEHVAQVYASLFTDFVISCNRVGYEDGIAFGGGSTIIEPDGDVILRCADFEADLQSATIDRNQLRRTRSRLPMIRDERPDLVMRELARLLNERSEKG